MSGVQNCDRALEPMIQCIVLAVSPLPPPTFTLHLPDIVHMLNVPSPSRSSPAMYYCERKWERPGSEAREKSGIYSHSGPSLIRTSVIQNTRLFGLDLCTFIHTTYGAKYMK